MAITDIQKNSDWKNSKGVYSIVAAVTAIAGAFTVMIIGAWIGILQLVDANDIIDDISKLTQKELHEFWGPIVKFYRPQGSLIGAVILVGIATFIVYVLGLIVLSIMTGNFNKDEHGIVLNKFDKIWTEVPVLAIFTCIGVAACPMIAISSIIPSQNWFRYYTPLAPEPYRFGIDNTLFVFIMALALVAIVAIGDICFVSLIKKLKAGKFLETALLGKLFKRLLAGIKIVIQSIRNSDRMVLKYVAAMVAAVILAMTWVGALVLIILIFALVPNLVRKYQIIKDGLAEVNSGNLSYEIPYEEDEFGPKTELDKLAIEINKISKTTDIAVQNEIKNQTMKTELISNVSHDIKTPLTSIISYLDILQKEGLDSPDAPEHLQIVIDKTDRLKILTEDLFEAAKASSGDMPCEIEDINIVSIVEQSLVEMEDKLNERNLAVITNYKSSANTVRADGKLLFRVIENVLGNIAKYSAESSRVYIDITDDDRNVYITAKNISKDQLNISPDELMERFKRGDAARYTEGSGLGLSIANDLAALMGGSFRIEIDGDMFKAIIGLKKA